jgi:hypothetical protein
MKFKYNKGIKGQPVSDGNLTELFGYTVHEIVSLTGANANGRDYQVTSLEGEYPVIKISVDNEQFWLTREIDFKAKTIWNRNFMINETECNQGIGTEIFAAQVQYASTRGFKLIKVDAFGDPFNRKTFNGYYTWGVLGFTMTKTSHDDFIEMINTYNYHYTNLNEMLATDVGKGIWKYSTGFNWIGEFDLKENSGNRQILNEYVRRRNINFTAII